MDKLQVATNLILEGAKIAMWISTCRPPEWTVFVLVSALLVPPDALLDERTAEGPAPLDMTDVFPRLPRSPRKVLRIELPPADLAATIPIPEVGRIPIVNLVFNEMGARDTLS